MTYYVEPDYWSAGYAEGDYSGGLVFASGASYAASVVKSAGNYRVGGAGLVFTTSSIVAGPNFVQTFPGINLNAKSNSFAAGAVTINSTSGLITAQSDVRMTGRPFWENTQAASGTWTAIAPQAEGFGS